tara:strand:+ start:691 stop:1311 length:621 start_codon:yes stop_codon:yes gene_type:complete
MPIIKDKYRAKGSQTRSRFLTQAKNRAVIQPTPSGVSTEQKRELFKDTYRVDPKNKGQVTTVGGPNTSVSSGGVTSAPIEEPVSNINNLNFGTANSAELLLTLNEGDTLNNIVIHNYNGSSASSNISLYWSSGNQENISFTISSGIVTATSGAPSTCLFSNSFPYLSSIDLSDTVSSIFKNVNKTIYIYAVSSVTGPSITYSMTSG